MPLVFSYYLREHPRRLVRVETGTGRVSIWRGSEWEPSIITTAEIAGLGGDAYYLVAPADLERAKGSLEVRIDFEKVTDPDRARRLGRLLFDDQSDD